MSIAIVATDEVREQAKNLSEQIDHAKLTKWTVKVTGLDQSFELTPEISELMERFIAALGSGQRVTVTGVPEELTTSAAAAHLGISRPTLMKLVNKGEIPSFKVGSHTRLKSEDVLKYLRDREERKAKAFAQMRRLDEVHSAFGD